MPGEIDFSGGTRGKFFHSESTIRLPIHLDPDVLAVLSARAEARGIQVERLVNELLRKEIGSTEESNSQP